MAIETPEETRSVLYTWFIDSIREEFKTNVTIFCGGFSGKHGNLVNDMDPRTKYKFPRVEAFFGAVGLPNVWYAGALMHGTDFKRSSGGFVHGFRYLVRAQARYILARDYTHSWEGARIYSLDETATVAISRVQNSSGLWQMQDELVDVMVPTSGAKFLYIEEVPRKWVTALLRVIRPQSAQAARCELRFAYGDLTPEGGGYHAPPIQAHEARRGLEGMSDEADPLAFVGKIRAARDKIRHYRGVDADTCASVGGRQRDMVDEGDVNAPKVKEPWPFELIFEDTITNRLPALFLHPIVEFVRGKERSEVGQLGEDVHAEWTRKHLKDEIRAATTKCLQAASS